MKKDVTVHGIYERTFITAISEKKNILNAFERKNLNPLRFNSTMLKLMHVSIEKQQNVCRCKCELGWI